MDFWPKVAALKYVEEQNIDLGRGAVTLSTEVGGASVTVADDATDGDNNCDQKQQQLEIPSDTKMDSLSVIVKDQNDCLNDIVAEGSNGTEQTKTFRGKNNVNVANDVGNKSGSGASITTTNGTPTTNIVFSITNPVNTPITTSSNNLINDISHNPNNTTPTSIPIVTNDTTIRTPSITLTSISLLPNTLVKPTTPTTLQTPQTLVNADIVCQHSLLNPEAYVSWLPQDSYDRILQLCEGRVHQATLDSAFDLCSHCQVRPLSIHLCHQLY